MENQIVIFKDGALELDVKITPELDTVWLTQAQMVELFNKNISTISRHINNIFNESEVERKSNLRFMQIANSDKPVAFYSLDVIISVGYRVKSKRGIAFRKWASGVLKQYLLAGYAVNEKRMAAMNKVIQIQSGIIAGAVGINAEDVLKVIQEYSRSSIFGTEKEPGKLEGILSAIHQSAFGQDVYPTLEEKAANLLYFIIKDHAFNDGCKRIGAALFLHFLCIS